jgi:hypothetical protein
MKNNFSLTVAVLLAVSLLLLTDPFMLWMPPMAAMGALLVAAVLLAVWVGFVIRETAADEREALHRMNAGRAGYLAGLAVLTCALVVQGLSHHIDPWIAGALIAMVFAKLIVRARTEAEG